MSVEMYKIEISRLDGFDEDVFVDNILYCRVCVLCEGQRIGQTGKRTIGEVN